MDIVIEKLQDKHLAEAIDVWNEVVKDGMAFPQTDILDENSGRIFFASQTMSAVAVDSNGEVVGVYILHPNNVGRCGHICNASYAVKPNRRGQKIGEKLVRHCMQTAREAGFLILQFNAVVANNHAALALYKKMGFVQLGTIPNGFLSKSGQYLDIIPHYISL